MGRAGFTVFVAQLQGVEIVTQDLGVGVVAVAICAAAAVLAASSGRVLGARGVSRWLRRGGFIVIFAIHPLAEIVDEACYCFLGLGKALFDVVTYLGQIIYIAKIS